MYKCIVHDRTGRELESTALASDAICWEMEGACTVIEWYEGITLKTVNREYPVPKRIVLLNVVKKGRNKDAQRAPLTNYNIFLRDHYTCQYCGRHESQFDKRPGVDGKPREKLEREHILPKSRGGLNSWENVVAACTKCNSIKANRTPEEAGMRLRRRPTVPTNAEIKSLRGRPM